MCTEQIPTVVEVLVQRFWSPEDGTVGNCGYSGGLFFFLILSVTAENKPAPLYYWRWLICRCLHESLTQMTVEEFELEELGDDAKPGWMWISVFVGMRVRTEIFIVVLGSEDTLAKRLFHGLWLVFSVILAMCKAVGGQSRCRGSPQIWCEIKLDVR